LCPVGEKWQTLVNGAKLWFLVPPGHMSNALSDVVGPFLFPPDAWKTRTRRLAAGQRPLRCVQRPGDVLWLPRLWWHATLNLKPCVAFGSKPTLTDREIEDRAEAQGVAFASALFAEEDAERAARTKRQRDGTRGAAAAVEDEDEDAALEAVLRRLQAPFAPEERWDEDRGEERLPRRNAPAGPARDGRWFDVPELRSWALRQAFSAAGGGSDSSGSGGGGSGDGVGRSRKKGGEGAAAVAAVAAAAAADAWVASAVAAEGGMPLALEEFEGALRRVRKAVEAVAREDRGTSATSSDDGDKSEGADADLESSLRAMKDAAAFIHCHFQAQAKRMAAKWSNRHHHHLQSRSIVARGAAVVSSSSNRNRGRVEPEAVLAVDKGAAAVYNDFVRPATDQWGAIARNFSVDIHKRQCLGVSDREVWRGGGM
jgi:hypothetical protein